MSAWAAHGAALFAFSCGTFVQGSSSFDHERSVAVPGCAMTLRFGRCSDADYVAAQGLNHYLVIFVLCVAKQ
jgi:hypothetical protein